MTRRMERKYSSTDKTRCKVWTLLGIVLPIWIMLMEGCTHFQFDPEVERMFTDQLFIQEADLPRGWWWDSTVVEKVPEAVSRTLVFRRTRQAGTGAVINQQLIIYTSEAQAIEAYPNLVARWFPNKYWVWPAQINFESQANQFHFACLEMRSNTGMTHFCGVVGRYGSVITVLTANIFDGKWFVWEDMERLLEAIDAHLAN